MLFKTSSFQLQLLRNARKSLSFKDDGTTVPLKHTHTRTHVHTHTHARTYAYTHTKTISKNRRSPKVVLVKYNFIYRQIILEKVRETMNKEPEKESKRSYKK